MFPLFVNSHRFSLMKAEVFFAETLGLFASAVSLTDFYFYWSLYPVATIVLSGGFMVSILLYSLLFRSPITDQEVV